MQRGASRNRGVGVWSASEAAERPRLSCGSCANSLLATARHCAARHTPQQNEAELSARWHSLHPSQQSTRCAPWHSMRTVTSLTHLDDGGQVKGEAARLEGAQPLVPWPSLRACGSCCTLPCCSEACRCCCCPARSQPCGPWPRHQAARRRHGAMHHHLQCVMVYSVSGPSQLVQARQPCWLRLMRRANGGWCAPRHQQHGTSNIGCE